MNQSRLPTGKYFLFKITVIGGCCVLGMLFASCSIRETENLTGRSITDLFGVAAQVTHQIVASRTMGPIETALCEHEQLVAGPVGNIDFS